MKRTRRNHGATFKAQVAAVKGDKTVAGLAKQFQIHPTQITHWNQHQLARSTAYYEPRPVSATVLTLMRRIEELHLQYPFAGTRMLQDLLRQDGPANGRRQVVTLMRRMGITAIYRKPMTSQLRASHQIFPYSGPQI